LVLAGICTIAVFNVAGVNVTKHISSLARSIIDVSRTILVWIIALIVTFANNNKNPHFEWENTRVAAIMLELLGFLILVGGNLVYNEIIVLPFAKPPPKDVDRSYSLQAKLKENESVDSD